MSRQEREERKERFRGGRRGGVPSPSVAATEGRSAGHSVPGPIAGSRGVGRSALAKVGSCPLFRHATLMLQHGADPLAIQAILGHANIRTTGIYVQADQQMTRKALELAGAVRANPGQPLSWQASPEIVNWLASL